MKLTLCAALAAACGLAASANATVVWDLNPTKQNAPAPSTSQTYTSGGFNITAYGYNNNGGIGSPQQLFFKNVGPINGAFETGLGVSNTHDQELQANPNGSPFDFIQFDLSSILLAGASSGGISVTSVQPGEGFAIYGSNTLGTLGTQLGGSFGSTFDNKFVELPNFGTYKFYSIVATAADVLPSALRADFAVVPEVGALLPVLTLLGAIAGVEFARRRRSAA